MNCHELVVWCYKIKNKLFQVLWQGHTIQVENGNPNLTNMQGQYTIEFEPQVDGESGELDVDTKPKVEKKTVLKKRKKADSDSDEEVLDNKLEDNPTQVIHLNL